MEKQYIGRTWDGSKRVILESTGEIRWARESSWLQDAEWYLNDYGEPAVAGHNHHGSYGYGEILRIIRYEDIE